jgi:L-iditol 2-dehydrogenase
MKAIVLESPNTVVYKDVPTPRPAAGEALVAVQVASICGSDILRIFHGHAKKIPLILGHEVSGIVAEVGPGVDLGMVGQRVALAPLIPCMKCHACQRGVYSACTSYSFIGSRQDGGFAEYMIAPVQNLVPVPEGMDMETAAILEPATVALHALERGGFEAGMRVAIIGVGSIGLSTVQWARILNAGLIIAADVSDESLAGAKIFGAHETINSRTEDVPKRIRELTGKGVDIALEMAGFPQTVEQALASTCPRGVVVALGNLANDAQLSSWVIEHTIRQELDLRGTWMSYSAPFPGHEWTQSMDVVCRGLFDMQSMITHRFPLSETGVFAAIDKNTFAHRKILLKP